MSAPFLPPQAMLAEQVLLGLLLRRPDLVEHKPIPDMALVEAKDFADPAHARIFAAIQRRVQAGDDMALAAMVAEFEKSGGLDELGGPAYLVELARRDPWHNAAEVSGGWIADCARRRERDYSHVPPPKDGREFVGFYSYAEVIDGIKMPLQVARYLVAWVSPPGRWMTRQPNEPSVWYPVAEPEGWAPLIGAES